MSDMQQLQGDLGKLRAELEREAARAAAAEKLGRGLEGRLEDERAAGVEAERRLKETREVLEAMGADHNT